MRRDVPASVGMGTAKPGLRIPGRRLACQRAASRVAIGLPADTSPAALRSARSSQARMIEQLLDFTQIRVGGGLPLQPTRLDLEEVCCRVKDELEAANPERSVVVEVKGDVAGDWDHDRLLNRRHIGSAEPLLDLVHLVFRSGFIVSAQQKLHRERIVSVLLEVRDGVLPLSLGCQQSARRTVIRTLNHQVAAAGRHAFQGV